MNKSALIKRITKLENLADVLKEEATGIRTALGLVEAPASPRGLSKKKAAHIISKRRNALKRAAK